MSLALDRVTITLGGRPLVRGVSLELNPGEVVGLLGPNGAGKTTTFNLITGLLRPDEGNVRFDGVSVTRLAMPQRARLGLGSQTQGDLHIPGAVAHLRHELVGPSGSEIPPRNRLL